MFVTTDARLSLYMHVCHYRCMFVTINACLSLSMHVCHYQCRFPITDINKGKQVLNQWFLLLTAVFVQTLIEMNISYTINLIAVINQKSELLGKQV